MSRRIAIPYLFLVLCGLGLWPAAALAQQADVLTGQVVDEENRPIVGARVRVVSIETQISYTRLTDSNGRYLIYFPDGGGIYILHVSQFGMEDVVLPVVRIGAEELLLTNVTMRRQSYTLDELTVQIERATPDDGAGSETTVLSQDVLRSLPLDDLDPVTVALLAAGVIATEADEDGNIGFSVGGMSADLNQVALDGVTMGEMPFGVPEEGVRRVEVTTRTADVSQGGFAGGQVRVTSARGNNQRQGSLTYKFDDSSLQLRATPTTNAYTRHDIGGSASGPIIPDKLFYNISFQLQRNLNHRFALAGNDPLGGQRTGVAPDSIARFLSILERYAAFPTRGQTGPYGHLTNDLRLQTRFDWNIVQSDTWSHSLSARLNANINDQARARINTLDLMQHGGEMGRNQRQAVLNLTSRIGSAWTNSFDLSYQYNWSDAIPYTEMPEAQIRVTSEFEDGTRSTGTLVFGGNRAMPTLARSEIFRIADELSIVRPILGGQVHRIKVGGSYEREESVERNTQNLFGTFRFASLADFEENRPDRFERTLTERESNSGRVTGALYFSDTWRVTEPLELTLGLRWDYSALLQRPDYNPAVEAAFGRRTDIVPRAAAWSPRIGFNLNLPGQGRQRASISGGIGYYAGRAPQTIYTTALRQTGLPDAELILTCIGDAVPFPDWDAYLEDLDSVPTTCADGAEATPGSASRAPTVTIIEPKQSLPGSLRFDLGYSRPLPFGFSGEFRYQYSLGRGLWGYRDINLDPSTQTVVGGRVFFGDPAQISARTGAVSMTSSRFYPEFGQVFEVTSGLESSSHQLTARINGTLPPRIRTNVTYTLSYARDQGSGSLASVTTAGNPNDVEWGISSNDRRHSINVQLTYAVSGSLELSMNGRLQSGTPFTPLVNRDINGDGMRNDRAFVFDPYEPGLDTAVANAMLRLLDNVSPRVRRCLESQFGEIAARNSCRNGWTQSLSMRANFRPQLPGVDRRLTITADINNILTGLDYLFHGREGMKGWGEGQRANADLLTVRQYDEATNAFVFEVNEGFGQDNRGPNAFRNAFSITISGRLTLGAGGNQIRPFATGGGSGGGGAGGGNNRGGGGGGGGGNAGGGGRAPRPAGDGVQLPQLITMLRAAGEGADHGWVVDSLLANPVRRIADLARVLDLSGEEVTWLGALADTLQVGLDSLRAPLGRGVDAIAAAVSAGESNLFGAAPDSAELGRQFDGEIRPHLDAARQLSADALRKVRERLPAEKWGGVPPGIRALVEEGNRSSAPNPMTIVDRILGNPLAALVEIASAVELGPEQVQAIRAASDSLQTRLNALREELEPRFANVAPADQAAVFQEVQPQLETGRQAVRDAIASIRPILTDEQWERVPASIRDPYGDARASGGSGG